MSTIDVFENSARVPWRYKERGSCVVVRSAVRHTLAAEKYKEQDAAQKYEATSTLIQDDARGLSVVPRTDENYAYAHHTHKYTSDDTTTYPESTKLQTNHSRDLVKQTAALESHDTKQFCVFWSSHNDYLDTQALRDNIVRDLLDRERFPFEMTFSVSDFPAAELTRSRFIAVYRMIDFYFFNTTLDRVLQRLAKENGFRSFDFVVREHIPEEPSTTCFYENAIDPDHPRHNFVGIVIQSSLWTDRANHRQVDGLTSRNKLYALVATVSHEVNHALCHLLCDNAEHGSLFLAMNNSLFGHSASSFTAVDQPSF